MFLVVGALRILALVATVLVSGCGRSVTCGPGFELQGDRCVPVCEEPCGLHESCATTETTAECVCIVGYVGDPCEWGGGIEDVGITSPQVWPSTNGALVDAQLAGPTGPGIARFSSSVTCNAGAVSQVVDMPPYAESEPFVVEVTFRFENVNGVEAGYGRAFRRLRATVPFPEWSTDRFCLGEAAYGGEIKFQVAAAERTSACFSAPVGSIDVDRFEILVADEGECPRPGGLLNPTAEVGGDGWAFEVELGSGGSEASLTHGVGEDGSDGARLHKPAGSEQLASMYAEVSVPVADSLPSPALRFWWKGSPGWEYYVNLGTYGAIRSAERPLDWLSGDGAAHTSSYCLPPWTHGNVVDLSFATLGGRSFDDDVEFVVDNVEVYTDAECGDSADLLDPSFDSAPNRWPGTDVARINDPQSEVSLIVDSERARQPGAGALELRYGRNDASLDAQHWVWVPATDDSTGPTLKFHSNVPDVPGAEVFWALGIVLLNLDDCVGEFCPPDALSAELPTGLGWRENTVCLPEAWAERWFRFRVQVRPADGPLEVFDPPRAVLLDDFEITSDEVCAR